jgi:hypothetical protein
LIAFVVLVLSHEGGFVLAGVILAVLSLRGWDDAALRRAVPCLVAAAALWLALKLLLPPGAYFAEVYVRAAEHFFDMDLLTSRIVLVLATALAGYPILYLGLARVVPRHAAAIAAALAAVALAVYWSTPHPVHAADRYYMRTALVLLTPVFGVVAGLLALRAESRPPAVPGLAGILAVLTSRATMNVASGALALIMLVHAVETSTFLREWSAYKAAVRRLADGTQSDPALGDPRFVSSARIGLELNRVSWFSTTPYLSVILSGFAPSRLVVDPIGNYFWLSCSTATSSAAAPRAVPSAARELVRVYSCLHR